jgi:Rad3-related DNA helicase
MRKRDGRMTYTLPHLLDRPGQQDTLDWILNSSKQYLILCAPTGFGKSPLAAACSIDFRTLALVLHKSLQSANYKEQYDFDILYGKSNYPCVEKNKKLQASFFDVSRYTAYDCGNPDCECPYQQQELHCIESQRVSLNYAKFLMSKSFNDRFKPDFLFLDEAHNLPDITMNFVGLSLDWDNEFLQCPGRIEPRLKARLNYNEAMKVFRQCARAVEANKPVQSENLKLWRKWKRVSQRIAVTDHILSSGSLNDWYYEATDKSLIVKPLTAKYHFKRFFGMADKVVLMSATITPNIAERLGLEPDEFDFMEVPNPWPIPSRLVYDLGGPAINWKSSDVDKEDQAMLIADILQEDSSGIIHVSSKNQAYELRDRIYRITVIKQDIDFHIPTLGIGTEKQYQEWLEVREPGVYCVSWNFREGVDLGLDNINIMAKTPWPAIGSNYERACLEYDPQWYNEKTAKAVEQLFGRHQRGLPGHYIPGSKMAYIADSSWHRLKTNLSSDFIRRVRKYNGK